MKITYKTVYYWLEHTSQSELVSAIMNEIPGGIAFFLRKVLVSGMFVCIVNSPCLILCVTTQHSAWYLVDSINNC